MRAIPQDDRAVSRLKRNRGAPARWLLTSEHVHNDIRITGGDLFSERTVLISEEAFVNASPTDRPDRGKAGKVLLAAVAPRPRALRHRQRPARGVLREDPPGTVRGHDADLRPNELQGAHGLYHRRGRIELPEIPFRGDCPDSSIPWRKCPGACTRSRN